VVGHRVVVVDDQRAVGQSEREEAQGGAVVDRDLAVGRVVHAPDDARSGRMPRCRRPCSAVDFGARGRQNGAANDREPKRMAFTYTNRKGVTYYLRAHQTKAGGRRYTFARTPGPNAVDALPEGYEVRENVNGTVSAAKARPRLITHAEEHGLQALVEELNPECRVEAKGRFLTVFESTTSLGEVEALLQIIAPNMDVSGALARIGSKAHYEPALRFELVDDDARVFEASRMMHIGDADWWSLARGPLLDVARKLVPHVGHESFYDLL